MDDSLLDSLAQSMLGSGGFDFPLSNGDLDFSLPPDLYGPLPALESMSRESSEPAQVSPATISPQYADRIACQSASHQGQNRHWISVTCADCSQRLMFVAVVVLSARLSCRL